MVEKIVGIIIGSFSFLQNMPLGKELIVFIISLMPILELRGGLLAAALLGLDPIKSYIICMIGNIQMGLNAIKRVDNYMSISIFSKR